MVAGLDGHTQVLRLEEALLLLMHAVGEMLNHPAASGLGRNPSADDGVNWTMKAKPTGQPWPP